ncbi:XrtN system VIT domain-containing protein [Spirosoma flavum]|uniref:XrtN system VIT domain-containing protein n=1 Tax=Spirosoma flavum TaxID=2048557 RepID=A0ABW6AIK1_9BACT
MKTKFKTPSVELDTAQSQRADYAASTPRSRLLAPFRDSIFGLGLLLLTISGVIFLLYNLLSGPRQEGSNNMTLIMLHYGLAVAFSLVLLANGFLKLRQQQYPDGRSARWLGMLLWLISAYSLNREMPVFQQSTEWLCWALVAISAAMVLYGWKKSLSVRAQQGLYAVLAFGWWLFVYMAVYIVRLYPVSVPLLLALGLSIHTFVPLLFAIVLGKRLWQDAQREEHLRPGIAVGLAVPVLAIGWFMTGWISNLNRIDQTQQEATLRKTSDLPDWVLIAQQLKLDQGPAGQTRPSWITNRLLLSNRVYDRGRFFEGNGWGLAGLTALDDVRQHDPLVVIASRLFPADALSDADQLSVLKVLSANRHGAEEKFWTGRHLTVEDVVSQVRIWPQFRLSYTEQTVQIRNQARQTTEEALLTFHLPTGSVVSAMSLWVNGKEEPARLTTVAKADSAYRTVVDVESRRFARDPSVVFWQEGDRVTVRVFPCRAGADRRVKIGITSPLGVVDNKLVYQNPYFDGPDANSAKELVTINFASTPNDIHTPWIVDKLTGNTLTHRGNYESDWQLTFQAPALSKDVFVLNEHAYQLEAYKPVNELFTPTDVYLDVNASWEKDQFTRAFRTATKQKYCRAWVFEDGLKQVTAQDLDATYERLSKQSFSLFPIYRITNPTTALLITKGTPISPILTDLRGSQFADHFGILAKQTLPIRTFCYESNLGIGELPAYLKTLAELRVLNVTHGNTTDLISLLDKTKQFPRQPDTQNRVVLPEAGIAIRESPAGTAAASVAPDHLARLFTYNHLLQQIGQHYFAKNYQTEALILEAQQAHVVSPLSSLVVLETARDYKRFGIKKDFSGLDNATLKEEGAVPEPHEWALLIMVAGLIGWLIWKKRYAVA